MKAQPPGRDRVMDGIELSLHDESLARTFEYLGGNLADVEARRSDRACDQRVTARGDASADASEVRKLAAMDLSSRC